MLVYLLVDSAIAEVMWEKKGLELREGGPVLAVHVNDLILRKSDSGLVFVEVKSSSEVRRWTIRRFIEEGIATQFWRQWGELPESARLKSSLRLVAASDVSPLLSLTGAARMAHSLSELEVEASQEVVRSVSALALALGNPPPEELLPFLQSIEAESFSEPLSMAVLELRARGWAANIAHDLLRLVGESKVPGPRSRSFHTRETLMKQLRDSGSWLPASPVAPQVEVFHGDQSIHLRIPLPTVEASTPAGPVGEFAWLTELLRARSVLVKVNAKQADSLVLKLLEVLRKLVPDLPPGGGTMTLALGSPTPDPGIWPVAGVYPPTGEGAKLVAGVTLAADEALFLWIVALAFRLGRLGEVARELTAFRGRGLSRLNELKRRHWPGNEGLSSPFKEGEESGQTNVIVPKLGDGLIRALLASQMTRSSDILLAARVALASENYRALAEALGQLGPSPDFLSARERSELEFFRAALALGCGNSEAARSHLSRVVPGLLSEPMCLSLALLWVRQGNADEARRVLEESRENLPGINLVRKAIQIWLAVLESNESASGRQHWQSALADLCAEAEAQRSVPSGFWLCLGNLALTLGDAILARDLIMHNEETFQDSVEHLALSALASLQIVFVARRDRPGRSFSETERRAVDGALNNLDAAIRLAQEKGLAYLLPFLLADRAMALLLRASFSPPEERRAHQLRAAQLFEEAAEHLEDGVPLQAEAARAWLLAGQAQKAAELYSSLPADRLTPRMRSNFSTALLMSGQPLAALKILGNLLQDRAPDWPDLANIGLVLLATGQDAWARRSLEIARATAGAGRWWIEVLLSKVYLKAGEPRYAERALRRAIEQRSFEPKLYADHLLCLRDGSEADLRSLISQFKEVFQALQADPAALQTLESQWEDAVRRYGARISRHAGRKVRPGNLVAADLLASLEEVDLLTNKLDALETLIASRRSWSAETLIEQVREIAFRSSDQPLPEVGGSGKPMLSLDGQSFDGMLAQAASILSRVSIPVQLAGKTSSVLAALANDTTGDPIGHWLNLSARVLENDNSEPVRCYHYVDGVDLRGFQRRTVQRVFREMHGRGILADEVGLGKTIEAGLILTEYRIRGLVHRSLILVPSPLLRDQWLQELCSKFRFQAGRGRGGAAGFGTQDWVDWGYHEVCILTYSAARHHAETLQKMTWDMVIVDEAHHLHNRGSALFKLVARLQSRHMLLLTATPLQHGIEDLYSLATLIRPTLFGTLRQFTAEFKVRSRGALRNLGKLESLLSQIMVRSSIAVAAPEVRTGRREFHNPNIQLTLHELLFYRETIAFVLLRARRAKGRPPVYYLLAREACSSPEAALATLQRMQPSSAAELESPDELSKLQTLGGSVIHRSKVDKVAEIVRSCAPQKVLVFVEFRITAFEIATRLGGEVLHGGMSQERGRAVITAFRKDPKKRLLITTPSQGEGLNLEFCSVLINYDLPWNPMHIEQRIGRIQRIGQIHDTVTIYSLASGGTIEEEIRDGLVRKVQIFERLIGQIRLVLESLEGGKGLEARIQEIIRHAEDEPALRAGLARLFDDLAPLVTDHESSNPRLRTPPPLLTWLSGRIAP